MAMNEDAGRQRAVRGAERLRRPVAARASGAGDTPGAASSGTARAAAPVDATSRRDSATAAALLALFIATLVIPIYFHIGTLRFSPVRVLLLMLVVPLALRLLSGKAGRLRLADLLIGLHCLWIGLALVVNDGVQRIPFAGITVVELGGGYLVGRVLVRNRADYRVFLGAFIATLLFLLPFAVVEFLTDRQYLQVIADLIADTFEKPESSRPRWGLHRTMAGFEHPILYGLYCSIAVGHVLYLWQRALWQRLAMVGAVSFMVLMSLSAAPMLAVMLQLGLAGWDKVSGAKWKLAILLAIAGYFVLDLLSNRSPIEVIISYLTFSAETGYTRILIFEYGIQSVWANPVFGIALGDWERPHWLTGSVDNFWLLTAMRYGIPAFVLIVAAIIAGTRDIIAARNVDEEVLAYRIGYLISLGGVLLTLVTVHMWGAVSVFVMMLLGAGMWFADAGRPEGAATDSRGAPEPARRVARYSREPGPEVQEVAPAAETSARLPYSRVPAPADDTRPAAPPRQPVPYTRKPPH